MIREDKLDDVLRRGGEVPDLVDAYRVVLERRRKLQGEVDELRAQRNTESKAMAKLDKSSAEFTTSREKLRELSNTIKEYEREFDELAGRAEELHLQIPNAPDSSVPDGASEQDNTELKKWGEKPSFGFKPQLHWDLGEALGILDFEVAAKLSGARFTVFRKDGARLSRALIAFMLDLHADHGYAEIGAPALVLRDALVGTGQLPKFEDDVFKIAGDNDLFLSPTGEVQFTNLHRDDILDGAELPVMYCGHTPCFRAEAGSYGKDVRGLIRQHQFEKVELVHFCRPDESYEQLELLRESAERVLQTLGLHYRVVTLCLGDLGANAAKTYDLEVWLPGLDAYREISSVSNFEDFQARRAKIRYRPAPGEKPKLVHTLNGSGLAVGRTIVAILEQCQQADGSIALPEALWPYMRGQKVIKAD